MAEFAVIPCEICNNLFTIDEYMTHAATHQQQSYSTGNMYGPMNKPPDYETPTNNAPGTNDGYTISADGIINYNEGNMYGTKTKSEVKSNDTMDDEKKNEIQTLSIKDANSLRDNGCVIIKNGIRKDLVKNALQLINNALPKGLKCLRDETYTKHDIILDLFNESAAFSLCQNTLGLSNVIIPKCAEIKLLFPRLPVIEEKEMIEDENWHIDGLDDGVFAPYSLGMRMVLSDQCFRFYKATHYAVFDAMQKNGMKEFIKENELKENRQKWKKEGNELCEWKVSKGDIILFHPFLCLAMSVENDTENIDYCVDFRIRHRNFSQQIGEQRANHLWLGYEQLEEALINEKLII